MIGIQPVRYFFSSRHAVKISQPSIFAAFLRLSIGVTIAQLDDESMSSAAIEPSLRVTRSDELFAALDGHIVHSRDSNWEMRICGIHSDRERYWIQLMIDGPRHYAATFRLNADRPVTLLREIDRWLTFREAGPAVCSYGTV